MRAAPSVRLRCGDGGVWRFVQVLLIGAGAASLSLWLLSWWIGAGVPAAAAALLVAALTAVPAWRLTPPAAGQLQWDASQWSWSRPSAATFEPCRVTLVFDFGGWMLLRVTSTSAGQRRRIDWLPVSRSVAGPDWHGLRVALHMPAAASDGSADAAGHDLIR